MPDDSMCRLEQRNPLINGGKCERVLTRTENPRRKNSANLFSSKSKDFNNLSLSIA